jgi:hypothetical protein
VTTTLRRQSKDLSSRRSREIASEINGLSANGRPQYNFLPISCYMHCNHMLFSLVALQYTKDVLD